MRTVALEVIIISLAAQCTLHIYYLSFHYYQIEIDKQQRKITKKIILKMP